MLDDFKRHYAASNMRGACRAQYAGYPQKPEDLLLLCVSRGLESAKADGFELPGYLRKEVSQGAGDLFNQSKLHTPTDKGHKTLIEASSALAGFPRRYVRRSY